MGEVQVIQLTFSAYNLQVCNALAKLGGCFSSHMIRFSHWLLSLKLSPMKSHHLSLTWPSQLVVLPVYSHLFPYPHVLDAE